VKPRVAVAASGGRDSTALLHCTLRQARLLGVEVLALHVQHGLLPEAGLWSAHVRAQCRRWGRASGTTLPEVLRGMRPGPSRALQALAHMARQAHCGIVLLAHRRD
jgi:tRNA(Ile)-lysidine synthase